MIHKNIVDSISNAIEVTGNAFDRNFTSKEEYLEYLKLIQEHLTNAKLQVVLSETQGNWMQRSWRPILALSFGFIVIYTKFLAPAFGFPNTELEHEFWNLLQLMLGGYVVGRTAEKIAPGITESIKRK